MAKKIYPYNAFVVTAALSIREVTLTGPGPRWVSSWEQSAHGPTYSKRDLHPTRGEAITAAKLKLVDQEARLAKSQLNLAQRRANLAKAEAA
ncbi:hypothetical protein [Duganella sp. FT27W]|uniref:hypothetical protein n=1 Tax=Duganella sp. FT27W TaxID=2654636 RepID=UPI00128D598A|nr:hypothetical protein [Duganella sp. FT27W]MPQ56364.1 hypothetical protein [Duganella sp. FT27W]